MRCKQFLDNLVVQTEGKPSLITFRKLIINNLKLEKRLRADMVQCQVKRVFK